MRVPRHGEYRRMFGLNPAPLVAGDAQHGVRDTHVLHGLADMRIRLHLAIGGAKRVCAASKRSISVMR